MNAHSVSSGDMSQSGSTLVRATSPFLRAACATIIVMSSSGSSRNRFEEVGTVIMQMLECGEGIDTVQAKVPLNLYLQITVAKWLLNNAIVIKRGSNPAFVVQQRPQAVVVTSTYLGGYQCLE